MKEDFGVGVKFEDADYLGVFARLILLVVDLVLVSIICGTGFFIDRWLMDSSQAYYQYYSLYSALFLSYLYLTAAKTSKTGTLGQIITRSKILTIHGDKPSQLRITFRLFFWVIGPFNSLSDLAFLTIIKEKRTLRDCYCGTIVIRKNAEPIEENIPVRFTRIYALGLNIMYRSCYSENT
jgi:uncharacterized RDD family membrane protein YckC